jgi:hypothetical protein
MTDDVQAPQSAPTPATDDPLASLEELLNKAKSKRTTPSSGRDVAVAAEPSGPSPEEILAQQRAEEQAQLAIREQQGEIDRQEQLLAQRQKMSEELQTTPQYQARQEQDQEEEKKVEQQKAEQQGHVIYQIDNAKV